MNQQQEKKDNLSSPSRLGLWARAVHVCGIFCACSVLGMFSVIAQKPTESQYEQRTLAKFPPFSWNALFSGSLAAGIDQFYTDTFPLREFFSKAGARIREMEGVTLDDAVLFDPGAGKTGDSDSPMSSQESSQGAPSAVSQPESSLPPAASSSAAPSSSGKPVPPSSAVSPSSSAPPPPSQLPDEATGEKSGSIFLYKDLALEIFYQNLSANDVYVSSINRLAQRLPQGVTLYSLVVPNHTEFALPEKYRDVSQPQKPVVDRINAGLAPQVVRVDGYGALQSAYDGSKYLYFRSDHHWTGLGAYYAYTAFAKAAGFGPLPLSQYRKGEITGFLGSLYRATQYSKLEANPDTVEYRVPPGEYSCFLYQTGVSQTPVDAPVFFTSARGANAYSVFLGGDHPLMHIQNRQVSNGRKILVIKDSFGNAFSPYLIPHYEDVYVADLRSFDMSYLQFISQNRVTDVLIVDNTVAASTSVYKPYFERFSQ